MTRRTTRSVERGITWLPRHDSYYVVAGLLVSSREVDPLCVTQAALLEVEEAMARAGDMGGYGLLTGHLCSCPRTRQNYILIDGARTCPPLPDTDDIYGQMALALGDRIVEVERSGRIAVGCYLGGAAVVPQPSASDVGLLRTLFPHPWQTMLVRYGQDLGHGGVGAFVRIEPMNMRAYAAPFVELLPSSRRRTSEPPRSAVAWSNYHATEPVAEQALTSGIAGRAITSGPRGEPIGRRVQERFLSAVDGLLPRRRQESEGVRGGGQGGRAVDTAAPPVGYPHAAPAAARAFAASPASADTPLFATETAAASATALAVAQRPVPAAAPPPLARAQRPPRAPQRTPIVSTVTQFPGPRASFTARVSAPPPPASIPSVPASSASVSQAPDPVSPAMSANGASSAAALLKAPEAPPAAAAPVVVEPVVVEPVVVEPAVVEPALMEPVAAPSTSAPVTDAPPASHVFETAVAAAQAPVMEAPLSEARVMEVQAAEAPVVDGLIDVASVAEIPVGEAVIAEPPVAEPPVAEPLMRDDLAPAAEVAPPVSPEGEREPVGLPASVALPEAQGRAMMARGTLASGATFPFLVPEDEPGEETSAGGLWQRLRRRLLG